MLKRIRVFKGADDQWYFHVKGANGEIVAASEGYSTKEGAKRGARTLIRLILTDFVDAACPD